jgi:c-di-GMP-binding flagellar brake protein YcgR
MKLHEILEPGQRVKLENETRKRSWSSTVQDIADGIVITFSEEDRSLLGPEDRLVLVISGEKGLTRVRVKEVDEPSPAQGTLTLTSLEEDIKMIQRRAHFRMEKPLVEVAYRIVRQSNDLMSKEWHQAQVINLSGGGAFLKVKSDSGVLLGAQMMLRIKDLNTGETVNAVANVIRCTHKKDVADCYDINLSFAIIDERDRDKIIGWLFREQLERADHLQR